MPSMNARRLRLTERSKALARLGPPRPRKGQHYLKGPVPLDWLSAAARLPGKSLHVGVALWYAAGLARSRIVSLSNLSGARFGLDRNAKYRALQWLEEAGLVAVERGLGRAPKVTICSVPAWPQVDE